MRHAALFLAAALIPAQAFADEVTVQTNAGPVSLAAAPASVVALDLAAVDTLDALGIAIAGVPEITPPHFLVGALDGVPRVGTLFEPDFEALAAMTPDLIIAGGRSQSQVEPLSRIAPTIDMTISGDVVGLALDRALAYGTLFGKEAEAEALVAETEALIASAQAAAEGKGAALILQTNGGTVAAYGDDSRFGWLHTRLNLPEAFPGITAETHGESVSFEFIAEVDPEWILVIDRAAAIGQEGEAAAVTLDNPLVNGTRAGEAGHIIYLDGAALYLVAGGIQSTNIVLQQVIDAFGG